MNFISYAQNFEDVMLHRALKDVDKGFYLDVGANDPVVDSVTKAFYDAGWRGINIEPVGQWYEKLQQDRPDDINLQVAVGARKGNINFYEVVDTGLSTIDESIAKRHAQEHGYELKSYKVPVVRLTTICEQHPREDIHFLKIDVEGAEHSVLKGLNLKKIRPWIILVESTLPNTQIENYEEWEPILTGSGYHYVYFDGLSRYYVADEHENLDRSFTAPPNVFDCFKRANEDFLERQSGYLRSEWDMAKNQINKEKETAVQAEQSLQESKQQRQQVEIQLQALQAESQQREEKLQGKETRLQELLLTLVEKETKLQESAVLLTDSSRQADKLQATLVDSQQQQQTLEATLQETHQQRQQVEMQLQTLQAEAQQREEKLQEKETRLQELLLTLVEKETKLQESAVLLTDSNQQADKLQTTLVDSQQQQQTLEATLQETHQQRQQIEMQLQTLQAESQQREEKLQEKEESINWLNKEWDAAKQKLDEVHQSNHYWWSEADRLGKEIQAIYISKFWRITWPLRKLMQLAKWFVSLPVRFAKIIYMMSKRAIKYWLLILMKLTLARPGLKKTAKTILLRYPNIQGKLRSVAVNNHLLNNPFVDTLHANPGSKIEIVENENVIDFAPSDESGGTPAVDSESTNLDKLFSVDAIFRVSTLIHERSGQ